MEQPKMTTHDQCPVCGSIERVVENIARREKEAGRMNPSIDNAAITINSIVAEPKWMDTMPYGSNVPSIIILIDVCEDCGTVYAIRVVEGKATKSITPNKPVAGISRN